MFDHLNGLKYLTLYLTNSRYFCSERFPRRRFCAKKPQSFAAEDYSANIDKGSEILKEKRMGGLSGFQVLGLPGFQGFEVLGFWVFGVLGFWVFGVDGGQKKRGCTISQSKEIVSDNYLATRRLHRFMQIFIWKIYDFHLRKSALSAGE